MAAANKLFSKTSFGRCPGIRGQESKGDDAIVYAKLFCPQNGWRWYITEFDRDTGEAFGLVAGLEVELGSFAIGLGDDQYDGESMQDQNNNWRGKYRFPPFERDLHWLPRTLKEVRDNLAAGNPP